MTLGPRNVFLNSPMCGAENLLWCVAEIDFDSVDGQVLPIALLSSMSHDLPSAPTRWASTPIFVGFYRDVEPTVSVRETECHYLENSLETQKFNDKSVDIEQGVLLWLLLVELA